MCLLNCSHRSRKTIFGNKNYNYNVLIQKKGTTIKSVKPREPKKIFGKYAATKHIKHSFTVAEKKHVTYYCIILYSILAFLRGLHHIHTLY